MSAFHSIALIGVVHTQMRGNFFKLLSAVLLVRLPEFLAGHALLEVERALSHLLRDAVAHLDVVRLVAADQTLGHCNRRDSHIKS